MTRAASAGTAAPGSLLNDELPRIRQLRQRVPVGGPGADRLRAELDSLIGGFLGRWAVSLYDEVTEHGACALRMSEVVNRVRATWPGLLATASDVEDDRYRPAAEQCGWELEEARLLHHVLADPRAGCHLLDSMRQPTRAARERSEAYQLTGQADLGAVSLRREGEVSWIVMNGSATLNAEDVEMLVALETAADLALCGPGTRTVALRGGVMTHPRYAGRRVFCAGINLKKLATGAIPLVAFLLEREAGYIAKIMHGLKLPSDLGGDSSAKPWLAAVEGFAIGGGAQVLLVCDRVVAEDGAFASLPAAQEGIIPGAANLRLPAIAGPRAARRMILTGAKVGTADSEAGVFFDRVVPVGTMDGALDAELELLSDPAVQINRAMLNLSIEPQDSLRRYLSVFALEQSGRARSADVLAKSRAFATRETPA